MAPFASAATTALTFAVLRRVRRERGIGGFLVQMRTGV